MITSRVYMIAGGLLLAGAAVAYHLGVVSDLKVEVAQAQSATATADKKLSDRIAAEATTVAAAVTKALKTEREDRETQQRKLDDLEAAKKRVDGELAAARERLYNLAKSTPAPSGPGRGDVPSTAPSASRVQEASAGGLSPADRALVDGLLQVAADANADAAARNFVSDQYQVSCQRVQ